MCRGAIIALLATLACAENGSESEALTGIEPEPAPETVRTELSVLTFLPGWFLGSLEGKTLPVTVTLVDTSRPWLEHERLEFIIESSSGDREISVRGTNGVCRERAGRLYDCSSFLIVMEAGHSISELSALVGATGGRIESSFLGGGGTVRLLQGELTAAMEKARSWPHVLAVEHNNAGRIGTVPGELVFSDSALRFAPGTAVPFDGAIQVAPGDQVRVLFLQPAGTYLVAQDTSPS